MIRRSLSLVLGGIIALTIAFCALALADQPLLSDIVSNNQAIITDILSKLPPGQVTVQIDDMIFKVSDLERFFLDTLAANKGAFNGTEWTNGMVYYVFETAGSEAVTPENQDRFRQACAEWQPTARLQFVETTIGQQANYILVKNDPQSNSSYVGMVSGEQELRIANWPFRFIIAHEIGHALGLTHEHQRSDRDNYVDILTANIDPAICNASCAQVNFGLLTTTYNPTWYDFGSVMHYTRSAFALAGTTTIDPKPAYSQFGSSMGQRTELSDIDMESMAMGYDRRVEARSPIQGKPLICGMTSQTWSPGDPVTALDAEVVVYTQAGAIVSGLTKDNFKVYVRGREVAKINSVTYSSQVYKLNFDPNVEDQGLYDLRVVHVDQGGSPISKGVVLGGVLYSNTALIEQGLAWLKAQQVVNAATDQGYWKYGYTNAQNAGITALALQAFLAQGYKVDDPVYGNTIRRAIKYILSRQRGDGSICDYCSHLSYETAMSIVSLKSALKLGLPDPLKGQVETALASATNYFTQPVNASWSYVSWRYDNSFTSELGGDMSVNQWVYLALDAMSYADKNIWNKTYGYINYKKSASGGGAQIGYMNWNERPRGNTLAAIWGLIIAGGRGVDGALSLAEQCYNYIDDQCPVNSLISHPNLFNDVVYEGAGYYYYLYEFAKGLAMGGKNRFCNNEDWYDVLANRIDKQHKSDANGYYWMTGWTDPTGYAIPGSGIDPGTHAHTALALLALQVGTVPTGSLLVIRLNVGAPQPPQKQRSADITMRVDGLGYNAGRDENGHWYTTAPDWIWRDTTAVQELAIPLSIAANFAVTITNDGDQASALELTYEAYVPGNPLPVDSSVFPYTIPANQVALSKAEINSIGGLNIFATPPHPEAQLLVSPSSYAFSPLWNDSIYAFDFVVEEVGDSSALYDIDIFAYDFVDSTGKIIAASNFTFSPSHLDSLAAGTSIAVHGTLHVPDSLTVNLPGTGLFRGRISVETSLPKASISLTGKYFYPCGDFNGSRDVNIADVIYFINYIFTNGPAPLDVSGGDANCDGHVNIADVVFMINYIFLGGPAPCAGC